jgi:hemerythrin
MALLSWADELSVGVTEIDEQHKKLIDMTNSLHDAMRQGHGRDAIGSIVKGLVEYTVTHFAYEEGEFEKTGFPGLGAHKAEHASFVEKVGAFVEEFQAGKIGLSVEVLNFLSSWLVEHIQGSDKEAGAYLVAKGRG